jgi:hypothetical protein
MPSNKRLIYLAIAAVMLLAVLLFIQAGQVVEPLNLRQPLAKLDSDLARWRGNPSDQLLDAPTLD